MGLQSVPAPSQPSKKPKPLATENTWLLHRAMEGLVSLKHGLSVGRFAYGGMREMSAALLPFSRVASTRVHSSPLLPQLPIFRAYQSKCRDTKALSIPVWRYLNANGHVSEEASKERRRRHCSRNEAESGAIASPCAARGKDLAGLRSQGRLRGCNQQETPGLRL